MNEQKHWIGMKRPNGNLLINFIDNTLIEYVKFHKK